MPGMPIVEKRVLGIDPGTRTGFSIVGAEIDIESMSASFRLEALGTIDLRPSKALPRGSVFSAASNLLGQASGGGKIDAVVCEKMFHRGAGTETLIGIASIVEMFAYEWGAKFGNVQVSALKRWAAGSGKADKRGMVQFARFRIRAWGEAAPRISDFDDNSADAFHLARAGAVLIAESKLRARLENESPHGYMDRGFYLSALGKFKPAR